MVLANQTLQSYWSESDLKVGKQFMVNVGNSIDDVAWVRGRSDLVPYAVHIGSLSFFPNSINYTITLGLRDGSTVVYPSYTSGILLFRLPLRDYSVREHYFERLPLNLSDNSPVGIGANTSAVRVFAVKELTGPQTQYLIVAAVPRFRLINSTIALSGSTNKTTVYYRLYLPIASLGTWKLSQSLVNLQGNGFEIKTLNQVANVTVTVTYPRLADGFDPVFYHFDLQSQSIQAPSKSDADDVVVEVYPSYVTVVYG